ncbi:hypothetical protein AOQ84DRAFT_223807 [Glonium stellatum]|uniref:Uncharacterized protein n=1 Tax=Glonium stellatum TaxID=574774 RepID=A0A8E2EX17_9PEZI|nr:hypothetical protein AOQ84DRAFT_223807 [Glonium stellatum]
MAEWSAERAGGVGEAGGEAEAEAEVEAEVEAECQRGRAEGKAATTTTTTVRKGKAPRLAADSFAERPVAVSSAAAQERAVAYERGTVFGRGTAYERSALQLPPPPSPPPPLSPFGLLPSDVLADVAGNFLDADQVADPVFGELSTPCTFGVDAWPQLLEPPGELDGQWGYDEFMNDAPPWNGS